MGGGSAVGATGAFGAEAGGSAEPVARAADSAGAARPPQLPASRQVTRPTVRHATRAQATGEAQTLVAKAGRRRAAGEILRRFTDSGHYGVFERFSYTAERGVPAAMSASAALSSASMTALNSSNGLAPMSFRPLMNSVGVPPAPTELATD
jgi:hypothetical protein